MASTTVAWVANILAIAQGLLVIISGGAFLRERVYEEEYRGTLEIMYIAMAAGVLSIILVIWAIVNQPQYPGWTVAGFWLHGSKFLVCGCTLFVIIYNNLNKVDQRKKDKVSVLAIVSLPLSYLFCFAAAIVAVIALF